MPRRLFERRARTIVNFGWNHGRYLDYWSIVHFLTGIIAGTLASFFGLNALFSVVVITMIAILYEGFEMLSGVAEDVENVISDIAAATLGSAGALYIFDAFSTSTQTMALVLGVAAAVNIVLMHLGWRNYLLRKARYEGSYRYLQLVLYIVTFVGILIAVSSFYYSWSTH